MKRCITVLLTAAVPGLASTGCQVLSYTGAGGERFSRASLGCNTAIAELAVETGADGLRRVNLRGYQADAAQALGAVTEAAVRAAVQGSK